MGYDSVTVSRDACRVYPVPRLHHTSYVGDDVSIRKTGAPASGADLQRALTHDALEKAIHDTELIGIGEDEPAWVWAQNAERPHGLQFLYNMYRIDDASGSMNPRRGQLSWMRKLLPILCCFVASCANLSAPATRSSAPEPRAPHFDLTVPGRHFEQKLLQVA
jgi:hypothetical protein